MIVTSCKTALWLPNDVILKTYHTFNFYIHFQDNSQGNSKFLTKKERVSHTFLRIQNIAGKCELEADSTHY